VILEMVGNTVSGTFRLYNRGDVEAFNITLTNLGGQKGIVEWNNVSRLSPKETAPAIISNQSEMEVPPIPRPDQGPACSHRLGDHVRIPG